MDIETYRKRREFFIESQPRYRELCSDCLQPEFSCYCSFIQKFDPMMKFVILLHPIERRRRIATGRMSHLCLKNSELVIGEDFTQQNRINEILADSSYQPVVLYPGRNSLNLTDSPKEERSKIFVEGKTPVVFVIDGTWNTARKTMRISQNLNTLPRLCFTPTVKSQFRVRKQPRAECVSTIEAIHHFVNFFHKEIGQQNLLDVFNRMIDIQISLKGEENYKRRRAI